VEDIDYRPHWPGQDGGACSGKDPPGSAITEHLRDRTCGVGKSFIALALAQKACRTALRFCLRAAVYLDLALARADGSCATSWHD